MDRSGFNRNDEWGFRACEPSRNIISSMALVLLKTGIVHPGDSEAASDATAPVVDKAQMATAQKLLLFWRKPAVSAARGSLSSYTQVVIRDTWVPLNVDFLRCADTS